MAEAMQLAKGVAPLDLNIPSSSYVVSISIIDTTSYLDYPVQPYIQPHISGHDRFRIPSYAFLVHHKPTNARLLFDLGARIDWQSPNGLSPAVQEDLKHDIETEGWKISVRDDVPTILSRHGVKLDQINAIVWSHHHWDHVGDPSLFPPSTELIVGPGFKDEFCPGYPTDPEADLLDSDWAGRTMREIDFDSGPNCLKIGRFKAVDYFGDGSFYLLDTPGHDIGHLSALARTTGSDGKQGQSFVFLGGDTCDHGGEFRPTTYIPLPYDIQPVPPGIDVSKLQRPKGCVCPGGAFRAIHPKKSATESFYVATEIHDNQETAQWSNRGVEEFDANDDVLVAVAHDPTLVCNGGLKLYPDTIDDWKAQGVKRKVHWRFLTDFAKAVGAAPDGEAE